MDDKLQSIVKSIKAGGIGVFPTDTIYGLVGSALNRKTVERIYKIRKRDKNKPLIVLISSRSEIKLFGVKVNIFQKNFLNKVWPGKVSVILPCKSKKFTYLHRNSGGLAFRLPKNKSLISFLKLTGPLVAPSANIQGLKPALDLASAKKMFGIKVDFYYCSKKIIGKPSALVKLQKNNFAILR
jgi:L-threonylcarbamoyladenylate synthase